MSRAQPHRHVAALAKLPASVRWARREEVRCICLLSVTRAHDSLSVTHRVFTTTRSSRTQFPHARGSHPWGFASMIKQYHLLGDLQEGGTGFQQGQP